MAGSKKEQNQTSSLVERREFLGTAATLAGTSLFGAAAASPLLGQSATEVLPPVPAETSPTSEMTPSVTHESKRFQAQRWLLDAVIKTVGVEWDQGRLRGLPQDDAAGIRARVHKFDDITREFARSAVRREKAARKYEQERRKVAARENYFWAALLYAHAQWPIFEVTRENLALNQRRNACYAKYIEFADHKIRRVEIPFGASGKSLPGYLHLPPNQSGRVPCVWSISGLDSTKETGSALYGDKLRERGIATLALEGPGQGECALRGIHVSATNWMDAGRLVLDWLRSQKEIDPNRIALRGVSRGSFWSAQVASVDSHIAGTAAHGLSFEPGSHTSFGMSSPTFKLRYMYYAGLDNEAEFDKFAQTLSLKGVAEKITCPYLVICGEDDQQCPLVYGYEFLESISVPKQMLVYEGADHGVSDAASTTNGPDSATYTADWLQDRLEGKPMETKHMWVDSSGVVHESTFEQTRSALSIPFLPM
ncbi:MAG TPA: alpha/beta hydrolase [Candidatus Acidoferrales bacterium]|nr:alpha/beta hydrolase [Candidatus Acidoferrales bacterium]